MQAITDNGILLKGEKHGGGWRVWTPGAGYRSTAPRKGPKVSQGNTGQAHVAAITTQETGEYAQEDKIRIVLDGFRREVTVSDVCRREGIKPGVFYAWTKKFTEAGKESLTRDTVRDATPQEIDTSSGRATI